MRKFNFFRKRGRLNIPIPKYKIQKKGKKYYVPFEISIFSPKEQQGKFGTLIFSKKPTPRQIEKKTIEYYRLHPEVWYHFA